VGRKIPGQNKPRKMRKIWDSKCGNARSLSNFRFRILVIKSRT
jgi:hypothetical protein